MTDSFSNTQIKQLKQVIGEGVDKKLSHYPTNAEFGQILEKTFEDKLGGDFKERLNQIENNTDMACKISKDTREELVVTQAKVDQHENQIIALQHFTSFATT